MLSAFVIPSADVARGIPTLPKISPLVIPSFRGAGAANSSHNVPVTSRQKLPIHYRIIVFGALIMFAPLWIPLVAALMVLILLYCSALYLAIWTWWLPRGKNVLIVYSNSPIWHDYMAEKIIAPLQSRAVVLNWSERKQWRRTLAVL